MATTGYDIIKLRLQAFVNRHLIFKGFIWAQEDQVYTLASELDEYPILVAYPDSSSHGLNTKALSVGIRVLDIKKVNRSNESSIIHNTNLLLDDLRVFFGEENRDEELYLEDDIQATPLNNVGSDKLDGWEATLTFDVDQIGLCEIPLNPVSHNSIIPKVYIKVNGILKDTINITKSETTYNICFENTAGLDVSDGNNLQGDLQILL